MKRYIVAGVVAAVALLAVLAGAGAVGSQSASQIEGNIRTLQ